MVIPETVEAKIRYLQNKFPSTEWSGVLFTTHTGSFEAGDLVITCQDLYPMDLGNSTYTEFFMSEEVTAYIAEHSDELWDCDMGLIHSHHSMTTFFSGTDQATLRSEGNDTNCFVSLIVNNEGTYTAAITRKLHLSEQREAQGSYEFFGEGAVPYSIPSSKTEHDIIEYFMLDIEKSAITNPYQDIDRRFEEIRKRKNNPTVSLWTSPDADTQTEAAPKPWRKRFFEEPDEPVTTEIDPKAVSEVVAKVLLCSLVVHPEKINMQRWVRQNMRTVYDEIFGDSNDDKFNEYAEWVVPYALEFISEDENAAAAAFIKELDKYVSNTYIDAYKETASFYIEQHE